MGLGQWVRMFKVHPEIAVEADMVMMVSEVVVVISVEEVVEATTVETDSKLQFKYLLVYRKGPLKQHNIITTVYGSLLQYLIKKLIERGLTSSSWTSFSLTYIYNIINDEHTYIW